MVNISISRGAAVLRQLILGLVFVPSLTLLPGTTPKTVDPTFYPDDRIVKPNDKVLACWPTAVNPLVDFALSDRGVLTFGNAAEEAGLASAASDYRIQWARVDNSNSVATDFAETTVMEPKAQAPASILSDRATPEFIRVRVAATHPRFPAWSTPMTVNFKRTEDGWQLVGLVRLADTKEVSTPLCSTIFRSASSF